jgi:hypothetical protein
VIGVDRRRLAARSPARGWAGYQGWASHGPCSSSDPSGAAAVDRDQGAAFAITVRRVSTSVVLSVTPAEPIDPDRHTVGVPDDIAAALTAAGQPRAPGLWVPRSGPVRLLFQLSGPDRVAAGQRLLAEVRRMGYEADLSFSP